MSLYCPPARASDWVEMETEQDWQPRPNTDVLVRLALIDELVAKALANAKPAAAALPLQQRFQELAERWQDEAGSLSSVTKRVMHPSYQAIVGMGRDVVPILLHDLQHHRRDWFWALSAITQENPIDPADAGKVDKMISAWVNWGKKKGLL